MMCLPQRTVRKCHLCIINDESVCWQRNVEEYSGKKLSQVEPHIFAIAEAAYQSMCSSTANQSCIISGESGAGKVTTPPRSAATTLNTGPSILSSSTTTTSTSNKISSFVAFRPACKALHFRISLLLLSLSDECVVCSSWCVWF